MDQFARRLRMNMTDAERELWKALRSRQLDGRKFRRQHPIGPYVLDFFCEEIQLAVELDGGQHNEEKDALRTAWLSDHGIRVLRFWNHDVLANLPGVLETICTDMSRFLSQRENLGEEERSCPTPVSI